MLTLRTFLVWVVGVVSFSGGIILVSTMNLALAENEGVETVSPLSPGDALEYKLSNGKTLGLKYVDSVTVHRSNGEITHYNRWGNKLSRLGTKRIWFSPNNGQLPEQPMSVGLEWSHKYRIKHNQETYWRKRRCEVTDRKTKTVAAGTFERAWRIECSNQREDRDLPMYEITWYSSQGRIALYAREYWEGSNPGSREVELARLSADQKDAILGLLPE